MKLNTSVLPSPRKRQHPVLFEKFLKDFRDSLSKWIDDLGHDPVEGVSSLQLVLVGYLVVTEALAL